MKLNQWLLPSSERTPPNCQRRGWDQAMLWSSDGNGFSTSQASVIEQVWEAICVARPRWKNQDSRRLKQAEGMKGAGRPAGSETMGLHGRGGAELTSEQPRSASVPCATGSKLQAEGFTPCSLDPTQTTYGANPTGCSFPHLSAPVWPSPICNFTGLLGLCFRKIDTWMR